MFSLPNPGCSDDHFTMPRAGNLVFMDVSWEGDSLVLRFRERGTGAGGTIALTARSARTLSRVLDGTRVTKSSAPARIELAAEVRAHVQGRSTSTKPAA